MANLRIAYDYGLAPGVGGIGEYARGLLTAICELKNRNFELFLFCNSFRGNFPAVYPPLINNCKLIKTRFPLRLFASLATDFKYKILYPSLCKKYKIDIFHGMELISLIRKDIKSVSTVHDIFFNISPKLTNDRHNRYLRKTFNSLNKYNSIIAMSKNTKDDLIRFGINSDKVTVIYRGLNGVFLGFASINEAERIKKSTLIKKKYALPENYFLYVGNFMPRKNIPRLIDIFHQFRKLKKEDIKLVLVGQPYGEDYAKVRAQIKKMEMEKDVLFIGCVLEDELPYIYSNAKIFFFLSLYEGFGVPPLEAMAVGTPAIVAGNSSLRELMSGYVFLVDPQSNQQIFDAIDKILNDKFYVKEFTAKAAEYVRRFSWNKTAQDTINLYKKLAGKIC